MDRFGTLKLFVTVSLLGGVCYCWEANVQGPVKAIRGSCALVPCHTVTYSEVKWYKYKGVGYPVVYSRDLSEIIEEFKGRTSVPGYFQDGNCSLRIDNVKQRDGEVDLYVWVWRYEGDHKGFYDRTIKINVLDPVAPRMSVKKEQTEGTAFNATCKCRHSCPSSPPQISWVGLNANSNVLSHSKDSEGLWETEATATFKVTREDQNKYLSCRCVFGGSSYSSNSVALDVSYAPVDVNIVHTGGSTVVEGDSISLRCISKSKPEPTTYEWKVNSVNTQIRKEGSTADLQDVRRHASVTCIAVNSVGRGESQPLSLDVKYAPSILPGSFCFSRNGTLQCECQAEAWPSAVISWTVDGSDALFPDFRNTTQHNGTVMVSELTGPLGHDITCTAKNSVGTKVTQIPVSPEENGLATLTAGVSGAAVVVCIILGFAVTIIIRKKRRSAVPPGDLPLAKDMRPDKVCHDYYIESDEDVYVNDVHNQLVYEEQDTGFCIYENYDTKS